MLITWHFFFLKKNADWTVMWSFFVYIYFFLFFFLLLLGEILLFTEFFLSMVSQNLFKGFLFLIFFFRFFLCVYFGLGSYRSFLGFAIFLRWSFFLFCFIFCFVVVVLLYSFALSFIYLFFIFIFFGSPELWFSIWFSIWFWKCFVWFCFFALFIPRFFSLFVFCRILKFFICYYCLFLH